MGAGVGDVAPAGCRHTEASFALAGLKAAAAWASGRAPTRHLGAGAWHMLLQLRDQRGSSSLARMRLHTL